MSGTKKTLSTGTMNLRFMQRSSNGAAASALQRKEVIDEAAWDIGPEVRRAWGLENASSSESEETLSYESSYLPFFASSPSNGRSRYSKYGVKSVAEDKDESGISGNAGDVSTSRETATPSKKLSGISMKRSKLIPSKTSESSSIPAAQAPSANQFLRPRGIDSPALHPNSFEKKRKASVDDSSIHDDATSPHSEFRSDPGAKPRSPQNKSKAKDQPLKKKKMWPPNDSQRS